MDSNRVRDPDGVVRSSAWLPALLATVLLWMPISPVRGQAPDDPTRPGIENGVDPNIKPGDDFFAYANGGWLKATEIPAGKDRWGARAEITEVTRQQLAKLLDDAGSQPAGSLGRKVADFRAAYESETVIEAHGTAPIKSLLDSIARLQDKAELTRFLGRQLKADVDPLNWGVYRSSQLLGLSVEQSIHGEKTYVAFLVQGGLGLPDRENYLSTESGMQDLRAKYQDYIGQMLELAGVDRADQRAKAVMALETAIAQSQATREASANDHNADSVWTRADFASQAPGMDWSAFFAAAGLTRQASFGVWQPGGVRGAAALVGSQPLEAWKDYLRFHVIDRYADVLPQAIAEPALAFHAAAAGQSEPKPRAQRAVDATQLALGDVIGKMYVERYFPASQKARVQTIVANVLEAFRQRLDAVKWMSPASRTLAQGKLKTLYFGVGYPEKWPVFSDLTVDRADPVGNLRRVEDRNYRQALARLGQPVDPNAWWMTPQTVAAVLLFQQNAYNFPAAFLQAPKFDATASDAANYGAIGAIVGHEVSHYVDLLGAEYEANGNMHHWWTAEDLARFQTAVEPLVNQFSGYHPFPDQAINGKLTQSENIADLGGLAAAFDAYRRTLGRRVNDKEYLRLQDRQFFIGFARAYRTRIADAAMRTQVASNDHAPEMYRISTVRNIDAWYDAFDVVPGQRLYLEPKARVRIW